MQTAQRRIERSKPQPFRSDHDPVTGGSVCRFLGRNGSTHFTNLGYPWNVIPEYSEGFESFVKRMETLLRKNKSQQSEQVIVRRSRSKYSRWGRISHFRVSK
ncbi:unnamed protein product [Nezara viridula]|uniref:Uncharacterized protein n=1 Tax=Nezara viridula TaxID=85310 RepID=A0A9P0HIT4_NEZVI|nr:unnamed protein product [Nezara viridula]